LEFPRAEMDIAKACVTYLSFDAFAMDLSFTNLQQYYLFDYAARNWGHHGRMWEDEILGNVLPFLQSNSKTVCASRALLPLDTFETGYGTDYGTGMHIVSIFGLAKTFKCLLRSGAEADTKTFRSHRTPLSFAAEGGHKSIVQMLLQWGNVKADSKDDYDRTPLSYASEDGHKFIAQMLLQRDDVNGDSKDDDGRTPLSLASERGHESIVQMLLQRGNVKADSKDDFGCTPLSLAAEKGHESVVQMLLQRDDVNADSKDNYGRTPLIRI
jgi:ankyrin repeat protein